LHCIYKKNMKIKRLILLLFPILSVLATSCTNTTDPEVYYSKWKAQNEDYFLNMKDSLGYVLYTIPARQGGSSFYYKITSPGNQNSASPLISDYVKVNYRGTVINGNIFDQTYNGTGSLTDTTAVPVSFYANQLITGWGENLVQMKVGERRTIVIPYQLGYGTTGYASIPPYTTLIFDIQLISFTHTN